MVKLKGSTNINSHVQSICLPGQDAEFNTGDWCIVTGWGANKGTCKLN